jgi:mono/diheme cytochrome c family protein
MSRRLVQSDAASRVLIRIKASPPAACTSVIRKRSSRAGGRSGRWSRIMMRAWLVAGFMAGAMAPLAAGGVRTEPPPAASLLQFAAADRGQTLARQMCADCHAIERGRTTSPDAEATPFQVIANTAGMSPLALRAFLYTPHRRMPNIVLNRDDADDIIDYILSLSPK